MAQEKLVTLLIMISTKGNGGQGAIVLDCELLLPREAATTMTTDGFQIII